MGWMKWYEDDVRRKDLSIMKIRRDRGMKIKDDWIRGRKGRLGDKGAGGENDNKGVDDKITKSTILGWKMTKKMTTRVSFWKWVISHR